MRRATRLLPLLLLCLAAVVGYLYQERRTAQRQAAPAAPRPLPPGLSAAASNWEWSYSEGRPCPKTSVRARSFRQVQEPSRFELEDVELRLYEPDCSQMSRITCWHAEFDVASGVLYSDGEVDVQLGLPADGAAPERHFHIRSTGVTLDSKTGKVTTERAAAFRFDGGEGRCVGASYDPSVRELHLRAEAEVSWQSAPGEPVLTVRAGEMLYKERDAAILLLPWSQLERGPMRIEGGPAIVWLEEGTLRRVEAREARGRDLREGRVLEYAAGQVFTHWKRGRIERVEAERRARLLSRDGRSQTAVAADRLELTFRAVGAYEELDSVVARGRAIVELHAPARGEPAPDKRMLESESIRLAMRPGGREIERIETEAPGKLTLWPASPAERRRTLTGHRIRMLYGRDNHLQALEAEAASTHSEPPQLAGRTPTPSSARTWSRRLRADFDPRTQTLDSILQEGEFRYEEGERRASAERATMDARQEQIVLEGGARFWDALGLVSAQRITLDQRIGDVVAEGQVTAARLPDSKKGERAAGLLAHDQTFQARADRMVATERHRVVRYEGHATIWQGVNRIRGERIEIDRRNRTLEARGDVVAQFAEAPSGPDGPKRPSLIVVQARGLRYAEATGVAEFTGGIRLLRAGTLVTADRLLAHFAEAAGGSRLDRADAEGAVEIVRAETHRLRRASAEHAAYEAPAQKIVLWGGDPVFTDSLRGAVRGRQLTWFPDDDRLLVEGAEQRPAVSRVRTN
ncbi:MAG: hypothetical protein NZM33_02340 [Bryobacteraceae bacterium]|nr:hypothetical protein [Bryobacteraceae bacterium]